MGRTSLKAQGPDRAVGALLRGCGPSQRSWWWPILAERGHDLGEQPGSVKLAIRVCQPAVLESWPASV